MRVAGEFSPTFPVTTGACDQSHNGVSDVSVAKLDISGTSAVNDSDAENVFSVGVSPNPCAASTTLLYDLPPGPSRVVVSTSPKEVNRW